jgi:hypothetical protein
VIRTWWTSWYCVSNSCIGDIGETYRTPKLWKLLVKLLEIFRYASDTYGTSYIGSSSKDSCSNIRKAHQHRAHKILTIIPLKPRAPPPRSCAFLQISSNAELVKRILTPEYSNNAWYCETSEPLTSVKILRRSVTVRGASVVIDGSRDINSGIKLWRGKCYAPKKCMVIPIFLKI